MDLLCSALMKCADEGIQGPIFHFAAVEPGGTVCHDTTFFRAERMPSYPEAPSFPLVNCNMKRRAVTAPQDLLGHLKCCQKWGSFPPLMVLRPEGDEAQETEVSRIITDTKCDIIDCVLLAVAHPVPGGCSTGVGKSIAIMKASRCRCSSPCRPVLPWMTSWTVGSVARQVSGSNNDLICTPTIHCCLQCNPLAPS